MNVRIEEVRHRSRATHSRQPRQVRKEATVTGSCVCSGPPVPGFFVCVSSHKQAMERYERNGGSCQFPFVQSMGKPGPKGTG